MDSTGQRVFLTRLFSLTSLLFILRLPTADAIGCYVCSSVNGSDPACEDQFNAYPAAYQGECMAARQGRLGLFPASTCIKFVARKGSKTIMVRNCALYSGGITKDVEIGMLDHCGWIKDIIYMDDAMKGCVVACHTDGCNIGSYLVPARLVYLCVTSFVLYLMFNY